MENQIIRISKLRGSFVLVSLTPDLVVEFQHLFLPPFQLLSFHDHI